MDGKQGGERLESKRQRQMTENKFWIITDIDYVTTNNLVSDSGKILECFQRDPAKNGSRIWPGSKAAYNYLSEHAPETSLILNDKGEAVRLERKTDALKTFPVRKPAKMGMSIDD